MRVAGAGHAVTNRPDALRKFADAHPAGIVIKQLGFAAIAEGGGRRALYTHLLADDDLDDLAGVEHTMHYLQAFVPKAYDVHLVAVGRRLFACGSTPAATPRGSTSAPTTPR